MHAFMEDEPPPAGSLLPPATTQRRYAAPTTSFSSEPRIAPPFVARPSSPAFFELVEDEPVSEAVLEPVSEPEIETEALRAPEAEPFELTAPPPFEFDAPEQFEAIAPAQDDEDHRWEEVPGDEGVVEPAFEADTDAVLEALTQQAQDLARREDFPLEAFIVPAQAHHVPNGFEPGTVSEPPENQMMISIAERLEKLSHRLRIEDTETVVRRLAAGDRLDALLAGLLAGYLAGKSEQS